MNYNQEFEKLDKSMKNLTLELMKYSEEALEYQIALKALNKQYQACNALLALVDDGMNNTYYFKYCDMGDVKTILTNAGLIEPPKKR